MYLLGYDIGSSSVKACLLDAENGNIVAQATSPDTELSMIVKNPGWAEQEPELWWEHVVAATRKIREQAGVQLGDVRAIGISYQMHGLVLVDKQKKVLRPSIIWCDSRAVWNGEAAQEKLGNDFCLTRLLNFPGNFTASKLAWVKQNEPELFSRIDKMMLPGDYIAMKLTGDVRTTVSGLSEGIFWDFKGSRVSEDILSVFGFSRDILPDQVPTFSEQGVLSRQAAEELGLKEGIKITYRAGDQPNNAWSLNVLEPGEVATTAGTSGVVYGVNDAANHDPNSRVNIFAHVNHTDKNMRLGTLMCINGCGILFSWLKHNMFFDRSYLQMDETSQQIKPGSDGLYILPYGNGAERTLNNLDPGASVSGFRFNVHTRDHFVRAAKEGIVFAFRYGFEIMKEIGIKVKIVRAGYANLFKSQLFRLIFASTLDTAVELYETDGAAGAARGAGLGAGVYKNQKEAFTGLVRKEYIEPDKTLKEVYTGLYANWENKVSDFIT